MKKVIFTVAFIMLGISNVYAAEGKICVSCKWDECALVMDVENQTIKNSTNKSARVLWTQTKCIDANNGDKIHLQVVAGSDKNVTVGSDVKLNGLIRVRGNAPTPTYTFEEAS